ncbi:Uncharacterised protein [uncultured archaeon]|nr:Uncharacterised protein [uncultured archaeon]
MKTNIPAVLAMKQSMQFKRTSRYAVENRSDEWAAVQFVLVIILMCNTKHLKLL